MANFATRAVDASFRTFGKDATYHPPSGPDLPCSVILDQADGEISLTAARVVSARTVIEVRNSEVTPVKGGSFEFVEIGDTFEIIAQPTREDPERIIWTCTVDLL